MKRIIVCALAALSVVTVLASCGSYNCSVCYDKCSDKNSYNDGAYILCNSCKKELFEETVESEPADFFGEVTAE